MFEHVSHLADRAEVTLGINQTGWALVALWAGVAIVTGLAAATIEPIVALGRGAVVFAGVGAACAVALASAIAMFGFAAGTAAWGRLRPLPASKSLAPQPPSPPPSVSDPILAELVGGLAARLAQLDEKLNAAANSGAVPGCGGDGARLDAARGSVARAVDQFTRRQNSIEARIKAEAEEAELRSKTRLNALADAVLPRVNTLNDDVVRLRRTLAESETRTNQLEQQVFDIFRARDVGETLRKLDAEASELFDKLSDADERHYGTAGAWQADYALWKSRINNFWDILRVYSTDVEQPFAVTGAEVGRAGGIPDNALFMSQDMRFCYQMMVVVSERHMKFREDAFSFNAEKARPPQASAVPSPQQRPALATRTRSLATPGSLVA